MTTKMKLKLSIDMIMTVLLLCQMAYMLIGETAHEWIGMVMFLLFVLHNGINWKWYRNLVKGNYNILRVIQTIVNFLVLLSMVGAMVSGIMMSRVVFAFIPFEGGMGFARILHMLSAYWGFLFMSVHIGLHWSMILGMIQKMQKQNQKSKLQIVVLRIVVTFICIFGVYAFVKNNLYFYLFIKTQFVFFDMTQPLLLFFMEYMAIMGLCICITYYITKIIRKVSTQKTQLHKRN